MRVLFDECVPRRLKSHFTGHDIRTVPEMGWSGIKNGQLLKLMAGQGFEVLLTVDQNLKYQQNLPNVGVGILILIAVSNRLADLAPLAPSAMRALNSITPGSVLE